MNNKCVKCGNDLIPGDKFCRRCGNPINNQMVNNFQPQSNNTGYYNNTSNNTNNTETRRKDELSGAIIAVVCVIVAVLFISYMPTLKKTEDNDTIIIKETPKDTTKEDNNANNSNNSNNNTNNNNTNNNNSNNTSKNPNVKKNTLSFKGATLVKRTGYTYTQTTSGTSNVLMVDNGNDIVIIEGIYKASMSGLNSKSSVFKQQYANAGYQTGSVKYTTHKNKRLLVLEVSQNSYKMLVGFYEIDTGIIASFVLYDKYYTKYNYSGYNFLSNIFEDVTISSSVRNGLTYEIKGDISQIFNNLLTNE